MALVLKIIGWTLRASAAVCITWIVVSVVSGTNGLTSVPALLSSVAYHAAFATGAVLSLRAARRFGAPAKEEAVAS